MLGSLIGKWDRAGRNTYSNARSRPLISLTELSAFRRHLALGGVASELLITTSVLVGVFTYLDVPVLKALLIGIAVTLQAALGAAVLTRVLSGIKCSLLLLMGPGVVVGGALSFALFQIVGRGWLGLVATTTAGLIAMFRLVRSTLWQPLETRSLWLISQVLGLAALALTWEFGELLPIAIAFFTLGFFTSASPRFPTAVRWLVGIAVSGVIIAAFFLRQDYWWLVSDDYQILQVQATHLTESGVIAKWGSHNWTRYHWLPTGWSGLLDYLGDQPGTFVTLIRVMPFLYSASFASSLLMLLFSIKKRTQFGATHLIPAWVIISLNTFDWSAPSTGGSLAAVAASTLLILLALKTSQSGIRRLLLYSICIPLVTLTKFPAVFAIILLCVVSESLAFLSVASHRSVARSFLIAGGGSLALVPILYLTSSLVGGFSLTGVNPMIGSFGEFHPVFAVLLTLLSKTPHVSLTVLAIVFTLKAFAVLPHSRVDLLICSSSLFIVLGGLADVFITPMNSNGHQYFSTPLYFIGTLPIIYLGEKTPKEELTHNQRATRMSYLVIGATISISLVLTAGSAVQNLLAIPSSLRRMETLAQYLPLNSRVGVAIVVLMLSLVVWNSQIIFYRSVVQTLLIGVLFLAALDASPDSIRDYSRPRTSSEVEASLGSSSLQRVGDWLRHNTNHGELIATNYLRNSEGELLSDYSLAVWSEREFWVLGPRFFPDNKEQQRAVFISERFADSPNGPDLELMWAAGIRWFVVDQELTDSRSWEPYAKVTSTFGSISVLELQAPSETSIS